MRLILFITALRVPLLCALALASLAPLGAFSFSPFRGMLEGLFDVTGWGAFWVAMASWLTAAACWLCSLLTLNYGPRRIPGLHRTATDLEFRAFPWLAAVLALAPLSVLIGICVVSSSPAQVLAGSAAGFLTAILWGRQSWLRPPFRRRLGALTGYVDEATHQLLPGHWLATQFTALFVALWAITALLKYWALGKEEQPLILPTSLTFLVLLIGLLVLILSGLAFFFDRFRIPILLPCLALLGITSAIPSADQFVETLPIPTRTLPQPAGLLREAPTPILVCASGGGIAAAAWTATVLTSLQRLNPSRFTPSLVLFSGASGGSVGGMQFVAACRSPRGCTAAVETSSRSSLDAAAWGLVGPDLIRATVPFAGAALGHIGRGWALEQSWDPRRALRFPLSTWPTRPAVVFNATIVETGEGIGLGNVDLGHDLPGLQRTDFSPVAAARLSASFPFVTPTPRPKSLGYHFADGGYYDNYGVGAAVAFLERAYRTNHSGLPHRVLLIEIRASRSYNRAAARDASMLFQWRSPADTMLNVRDTAQRHRNDTTLNLLDQALAARGVTLERVQFEIPRDAVPLSWHLTASQTADIRADWHNRYEDSPESHAVARFLAQQP